MKKYLLILFLTFTVQSFAQENDPSVDDLPEGKNVSQTIEALKIAYITKELNLTQEEAQNFWPTYNAFTAELKKARIELKDDVIAFEEKKVIILKKFRDDFKKVLNNDDRVKRCFKAEPAFHKLLRKEWQRRQAMKPKSLQGTGMGNKPPFKPNGPGGGKRPPSIKGPRG